MLLNCLDEDEVCDVSKIVITDLNNINYDENFFSMNYCLYDYKLNVNNNYNDICECAYYPPDELEGKVKQRPGFSVVHIDSRSLIY